MVSKDVLWYVLEDLAGYLSGLAALSSRYVYVGQSFPEKRPFLGDDILPDAEALHRFIVSSGYAVIYSLVEMDSEFGDREYAHFIIDVIP